jgi:hypothetical protein
MNEERAKHRTDTVDECCRFVSGVQDRVFCTKPGRR